eukprot:1061373-Alexandrium_andersonii.AAC.1
MRFWTSGSARTPPEQNPTSPDAAFAALHLQARLSCHRASRCSFPSSLTNPCYPLGARRDEHGPEAGTWASR